MYKKVIGGSIVLVLIIGTIYFIKYLNLTPSLVSNDIEIKTSVEPFDDEYYKFLVRMEINRNKEEISSHIVYPLIEGLQGINFIKKQGFYSPSSIAQWPLSEEILVKNYPEVEEKNLMGFSLPKEIGRYQLEFLLSTDDNFKELNEGTLYYVHIEEKFGKNLSWVHKYPITVIE